MRKLLICMLALLGMVCGSILSSNAAGDSHDLTTKQRPHQDHHPKHGGTFFMAMDYKHHLEGVLVPPGKFYVYLYDAYTHPLASAKVKQAWGEVQWGDSDNAPKVRIAPALDGRTLVADCPGEMKFPVTLTLWLHLPGSPPHAKPELFTFPFSKYLGQAPGQHSSAPMHHQEHAMN